MLKRSAALVSSGLLAAACALLGGAAGATSGPPNAAQVAADVASSLSIATLPSPLAPSLAQASNDVDTSRALAACNTLGTTLQPSKCVFGYPRGSKTMVLWGDSHAFMWFPAMDQLATAARWRLIVLLKYGCPVATVSVWNPLTKAPYLTCNTFRKNMITAINRLNPSLVVMTEAFTSQAASANGAPNTITLAQWQIGLGKTFASLHSRAMKKVLLGSTVAKGGLQTFNPPACLYVHKSNIQLCTVSDTTAQKAQRTTEQGAARASGVTYVDVMPWLCSSAVVPAACGAVIGDATNGYKVVYYATGHLTRTYALFVEGVLAAALKPRMY